MVQSKKYVNNHLQHKSKSFIVTLWQFLLDDDLFRRACGEKKMGFFVGGEDLQRASTNPGESNHASITYALFHISWMLHGHSNGRNRKGNTSH